jgi:GTPase Era involved in 16S rRNA processing
MLNLTIDQVISLLNERYVDSYYDLYPGFHKTKDENQEYAFSSKAKAIKEAQFIIELFDELPDPMPLYRTVCLNSKEDIDLENPGDHWSFNKKSAIQFSSINLRGKHIFLLSCEAKKSNIAWVNTISKYMEFSGEGFGESENEIIIKENSLLLNVRLIKQLR